MTVAFLLSALVFNYLSMIFVGFGPSKRHLVAASTARRVRFWMVAVGVIYTLVLFAICGALALVMSIGAAVIVILYWVVVTNT
ncbi:MAG: hypothetical protein WC714_20075 [Candidatus Obscuribacterales bacterium]|jgi:hypothetical protein